MLHAEILIQQANEEGKFQIEGFRLKIAAGIPSSEVL